MCYANVPPARKFYGVNQQRERGFAQKDEQILTSFWFTFAVKFALSVNIVYLITLLQDSN